MSSYIAYDLDAINRAPLVARAAGVAEDVVHGGNIRMWSFCFREKTDQISRLQVRGFYATAPDVDVVPALIAFGHLEELAGGALRVRGADRYLRVTEARSKGGKAAVGNLKRGTKRPGEQPETKPDQSPGCSPAPAGSQPENQPGCSPALTPSTDDRTPNTEHRAAVAAAAAKFFDAVQRKRHDEGAPLDEGCPPTLAEWFGEYVELGVEPEALKVAYEAFCADPYWIREGTPFVAFMDQTRSYLGKVRKNPRRLNIVDAEQVHA